MHIPTGGIAPRGWLTETGPAVTLLRGFGLQECAQDGYPARTRQNVLDADGTLLVGRYRTGGSALTAKIARNATKPLFLLAYASTADTAPNVERVDEFRYWLQRYNVQVLNVAGNRESGSPGIQRFTEQFLLTALTVQSRREGADGSI